MPVAIRFSGRFSQSVTFSTGRPWKVIAPAVDGVSPTTVTRFDETGINPDRQMANTKDEEKELGILNEGMRSRDLLHGVWLTADPIGYGDGPNRYAYVHYNPITKFDPLGLSIKTTTSHDPETNEETINITFTAVFINESNDSFTQEEMNSMAERIKTQIEATYVGGGKDRRGVHVTYSTTANITVATSVDEIGKNDHVIRLVDHIPTRSPTADSATGYAGYGGTDIRLNASKR